MLTSFYRPIPISAVSRVKLGKTRIGLIRNAILAVVAALALSTGPVLAEGGGGAPQSLISSGG
jgi:hypothetical protein